MPTTYFVAWWNVENLFDEENSPDRTEKLQRALGSSLNGWTPQLRDRKVEQLAAVIAEMNGKQGPDLLGVCEVENKPVLEQLRSAIQAKLSGRKYAVAHADTRDRRGIDIAFVYDKALFEAPANERFQHVVMRRTATREILQVGFKTKGKGNKFTVFGNHWPSRSGGRYESAAYRAIAGETLAYFHERVMELSENEMPVLAMGDFNDEPFDESLTHHALSTRQRSKVVAPRGRTPRLWNLMWEIAGREEASLYFDNFGNLLDQFLVNKRMTVQGAPLQAIHNSVKIEDDFPGFAKKSPYPQPIPFGGMGKKVNKDGFSDHFPISLQIVEAD